MNVIAGKNRAGLTSEERAMLRNALHTEGALTGDYASAVKIRKKLGLGQLAFEGAE